MKILLVVPRYNLTNEINYDYIFPLGLAYISTVLKKAKHEVDCLNLNHKKGLAEEIINSYLDRKKYDFVCTGGNALLYSIIETILNTAKKHSSKPGTILGGPILTSEPDLIFQSLNPSFGVLGEGEITAVELLKSIKNKKDLRGVKGIIFKDIQGKIIKTPQREVIQDLDAIPWPDYEGIGFVEQLNRIHPNFHYTLNTVDNPRVLFILCSRSCPFQCTFCYHDSKYRKRSIENIMKEIVYMVKKYRINMIVPFDECFAIDKERMYDFCRRMKKLRQELPWDLRWASQLSVSTVTREMLDIMADSGCDSVSYGFESYSQLVLKSMKKSITPEQIDYALKNTLEANMAVQANFIFGDVAETKETAKVTLDYWKRSCKGQIGMGFIQPYPGSEIYKRCIEKGIIKDKLDFIKNRIGLGLWLNMTDSMSDREIKELRKEILDAQSRFVRFLIPKSIKKTGANIYQLKVNCPFCKNENTYNNFFIENKSSFGIFVICKHCHMRFFMVSYLQKIAYRFYPQVRAIRDLYLAGRKYIKKKFFT